MPRPTAANPLTTRALATLALGALAVLAQHVSSHAASVQPAGRQPPMGAIFPLTGYPTALCNDGTAGAYYFRHGVPGNTTWLFYLEGGKECYSAHNCALEQDHSPLFTTSTGWIVDKPGGLISASSRINPTFYNANVVQVHYCSSDYWSGAKAASMPFSPFTANSSWSFQGRAIALAALQDLAARNADTGLSSASSFVFAGSSAGALGAVYLYNDLVPFAPAAAQKLMIIDAGYSLSINGFDPKNPPTYMSSSDPTAGSTLAGIMLWNGHGDTACAQGAVTPAAQLACYDTAKLINSGRIPVTTLIGQSEIDDDQLGQHGWSGKVTQDTAHMTYATEFADAMKALLLASGTANSVFAPQRLAHTLMSTSSEFQSNEKFPGFVESPTQAVQKWFAAPGTPTKIFGNAAMLP